MFLDVQPEEVWAFWRFMQEHFTTTVVNKSSALEMQAVAQALDTLGIVHRDRFLKDFTTTIGRRIYTPFEVGSPKAGWDLWNQIVVCVHEHQHVAQLDREGYAFAVSYLANRAARGRWETEAYRTSMELSFWRYGTTAPLASVLANNLLDYGCSPEDVEVADKELALSAVSIRNGAILNEATHVALGWLNEHLSRLRVAPATE
ncbi:MAG: hypothetical protein FWD69_19285 [Polyangiaceae bacterium]|nr:hypothetical protein [Polyangiaceae bacterium]